MNEVERGALGEALQYRQCGTGSTTPLVLYPQDVHNAKSNPDYRPSGEPASALRSWVPDWSVSGSLGCSLFVSGFTVPPP